ncbi:hypothetical protein TIFTF001_030218 [Ficus carica]|uniref:Myb/SANT-like domain-containing protein n=1 Tax=Ficus carica TaxID=3494 RepID=A0AA88DSZ8_FICCA|nr:hypothetical protein TIFTF001_030218 [Ficus carica]
MPHKASGETYFWEPAKEKKFLQQLDDYLACSGDKHPPLATLDLWAVQFNAEYGRVPAHRMTLYQKKERMKKIYRDWKALQCRTGLGYDPSMDRVICSDEAWQSFIQGLRNKELYYNVFEKNHAVSASGYGSVTIQDDSTLYVGNEGSMNNSGTREDLKEDLTLTTGAGHWNNIRSGADAGPSRSRGSSGKRKQRDKTDDDIHSNAGNSQSFPWPIAIGPK